MKLLDKLKNVFFEEVEEEEEDVPKSYAKKVEVPKKKMDFLKEEEKNKKEEVKENRLHQEEKAEEVMVEEDTTNIEKSFPMMFDDDDFLEDNSKNQTEHFSVSNKENEIDSKKAEIFEYNEQKELYPGRESVKKSENIPKTTYSYSKTYYEEKEVKGFRPSPIISPIYGILDKNYRKEEVITKKEVRISASYGKPDLDSVRNKAFGDDESTKTVKKSRVTKKSVEEDKDQKLYDVNNTKPQVNKVTLADADEYYNDLGLAYNVDYSDASRDNHTTTTRSAKYGKEKKKDKKDVDDNLFDLIDSMYNKED